MDYFRMKLVSPLEKIFPSKEPSCEGAADHLTAFRGETVSFQIGYILTGMSKRRGRVSVHAPEGVQVRVRTVELVPCAYPCHEQRDDGYLACEPGMYPDRLEDLTPYGFSIVSGQWRSLWVDLTSDLPAGTYPVEIQLSMDEIIGREPAASLGSIAVTFELLDAVLPELSIPHTEWFHCDCLSNYYQVEPFSEEHWTIMENFIRTAVKRGCNMILTPIFTPPLDTAVGGERTTIQLVKIRAGEEGYEFSYDRFERWVEMCQRCGIRYFEISHLFTQWGAASAPKIVADTGNGERRIFGWDTDAAGTEYGNFLRQFLASFLKEIESLGIAGQCYFHISDEPTYEQLASYRAARNQVKDLLKDCCIMDVLSSYEFYKEGLVDEPVCANDHIEPFLENRPEHLWTYYCTAQGLDVSNRFIALPGSRTRILGTQLYKYRISGFLHWGYNFYNSEFSLFPIDPYRTTDADGTFPSGDPFLVYPGPDGHPVESLRLMLMEEATNDFRSMEYLESLTDRETVMNCIEHDASETVTFKKYPHDLSYLPRVRERIIAAVKKAQKSSR